MLSYYYKTQAWPSENDSSSVTPPKKHPGSVTLRLRLIRFCLGRGHGRPWHGSKVDGTSDPDFGLIYMDSDDSDDIGGVPVPIEPLKPTGN